MTNKNIKTYTIDKNNGSDFTLIIDNLFLEMIQEAKSFIQKKYPEEFEFLNNNENYLDEMEGLFFTENTWEAIKVRFSDEFIEELESDLSDFITNPTIIINGYKTDLMEVLILNNTMLLSVFDKWSFASGSWIGDFFYDSGYEENENKELVQAMESLWQSLWQD